MPLRTTGATVAAAPTDRPDPRDAMPLGPTASDAGKPLLGVTLALCVAVAGCRLGQDAKPVFYDSAAAAATAPIAGEAPAQLSLEEPASDCEAQDVCLDAPEEFDPDRPPAYRDLSLEEAVRFALANARVMRDLGGVVSTPDALVSTVYDPALVFSDPRFGEEAALSAFDARFAAGAFFEK
ncbi:MAG: hypothetical protein AAF805_08160, partial [Planctomycetota bacterium]